MMTLAISTARAPSSAQIAADRGEGGASILSAFPQSVFVATNEPHDSLKQMARMRHIRFPKTMADHLDWFNLSPTYFHLLIESKVLPPGIEKHGDAVWDFSEVSDTLDSLATVYFADVQRRGFIKIGYTANLFNRMEALRYHFNSPIEVMQTIPGTLAVEGCILDRFEYLHEGDELFWPGLELFAYIDAVKR